MTGRQVPPAGMEITQQLVAASTAAWRAIQDRHPDVPDVVLTLGSGTQGARRGRPTWATSPPGAGTPPHQSQPPPVAAARCRSAVRYVMGVGGPSGAETTPAAGGSSVSSDRVR